MNDLLNNGYSATTISTTLTKQKVTPPLATHLSTKTDMLRITLFLTIIAFPGLGSTLLKADTETKIIASAKPQHGLEIEDTPGVPGRPFKESECLQNTTEAGIENRDSLQPFEPEMVDIPGGSFQMGDLAGEGAKNELPVHTVHIDSFKLGKTEITFSQWEHCLQDGGCTQRPDDQGWGRDDRPVIYLSWDDIQGYIHWLNCKTGKNYRLPSEAEWEYATRAGSKTKYPWGNQPSREHANYGKNECCDGYTSGKDRWLAIAPVGSFPANHFGLYDMIGNVTEWVQDCWNESYVDAPANGDAWEQGDCSRRVLRGGSWTYPPKGLRSATRAGALAQIRSHSGGFRLAMDK